MEDIAGLTLQELMNVDVISSTKTAKNTTTAPNIMTTISRTQIEESGARTLADMLKMVAGFQVLSRRNGRDMVWIRGTKDGYNSNSLLLIDGIPMRDMSFRSWSPDEIIPLNNIDRIEIIRGPGSALYGGNAGAGIISIFTRDCSRSTNVSVSSGSFDAQEVAFLSSHCSGDTRLFVAGNHYDTDGHKMSRDRLGNATTHTDSVSAQNINAKLAYKALNLGVFRNDLLTAYPLYSSDTDKPQHFVHTSAFANYIFETRRYLIKPQFYYFHSNVDYEKTEEEASGAILSLVESRFESRSYGFENQATFRLPHDNTLTTGLLGEYHQIHRFEERAVLPSAETLLWLDDHGDRTPDSYNYAVYLQDDLDLLKERLNLVAGLRYDYYAGFGGEVSPRIGAVGSPVEDLTFKALWGKAFSPPTFLEMYLVQPSGSQGNSDLEPERISTIETEASYFLGRDANARVALFRNEVSNLVELESGSYVNIQERHEILGAEFDLRFELNPELRYLRSMSLVTSYSYVDARDSSGVRVGSVARHSANLAVTLRNKYFVLFNGFNFLGRRYRSETYHGGVVDAEYRYQNNKGRYLVWDASLATGNFSHWPFEVRLTVHNLLDKEHYNPTYSDSYYDYTKRGRAMNLKLSVEM